MENNLASESNREQFKKRSGTTDLGRDFEDLVTASILLRLIDNTEVKDFKLSSNDDKYGIFDDVVLKITDSNNSEKNYALQLKHRSKLKFLLPELRKKKGDFSINEYFHEFKKLKNNISIADHRFIIYTNNKLEITGESTFLQLDHTNGSFLVEIIESPINPLISNCGKCYSFKIVDKYQETHKEYEEFFNHFQLYSDQENVDQTQATLFAKFLETINSRDIFSKYLNFIKNWSKTEGHKDKLDKVFTRLKIAEFLLEPYLKILTPNETIIPNLKHLFRAIQAFDITIIDAPINLEHFYKNEDLKCDIFNADTNNLFRLQNDRLKIIYVEITNQNQEFVYKALNFCKQDKNSLKYILSGNVSKKKLKTWNIFQDLSNLLSNKLSKELKNILQNFSVSLQGKRGVTLQQLVEIFPDSLEIFSVARLFRIADGNFAIGNDKTPLPEYYIDRHLTKILIDAKDFLLKVRKDILVLIDVDTRTLPLLNKVLFGPEIVDVDDFLSGRKKIAMNSGFNTIFFSKNKCSKDKFDELKKRFKKMKNYHHFKMIDEDVIEWVSSDSGIEDLKKFRHIVDTRNKNRGGNPKTDYFIEESQLIKDSFDKKVSLICGSPGIGKTSILEKLMNSQDHKYWAIKITAGQHSQFFERKQGFDDVFSYVVKKCSVSSKDSFVKAIVELYKATKRIVFFWDGLDEISRDSLPNLINAISKLQNLGFTQWITSRTNLQNYLEETFNIFARNIRKFDESNQIEYITKRLKSKCESVEELQEIIVRFKKNLIMTPYSSILEVPLQIHMLTELFIQDLKKYKILLEKSFSLVDLFYHFVDLKFDFQFKKEMIVSQESMDELKEYRIENYEKISLSSCFEPEICKKFNVVIRGKFLENLRQNGDRFGIVTDINERGVASFVHFTYGEYFAARYLAENYKSIAHLKNFIFDEKYENVRYIFDLILAQNSELHKAALCRDFDILFKHIEDRDLIKSAKDKGGRNLLHILSSWGMKHPIVKLKEVAKKQFYISPFYLLTRENEVYQQIVTRLTEHLDPSETDVIFGYNSFIYADKTLSLGAINSLLINSDVNVKNFENLFDFLTISYYLTEKKYMNLAKILDKMGSQVKFDPHLVLMGETFLHMACRVGCYVLVKILVEKGADVNAASIGDGHTPLRLASYSGHLEIAKLLIKRGAQVNKASFKDHVTPLIVACEHGHFELVKLYIENGAKINVTHIEGMNPVYFASSGGFLDIVEYLYERKANIHAPTLYGFTCVYIASEKGHTEVLKFLISKGAYVDVPQKDGFTPLMIACDNKHLEIMNILIKYGADVNAVTKRYQSTLIYACQRGNLEIVKLLIAHKAKINIVDKLGCTALIYAIFNTNFDVIKYLVWNGSDVNLGSNGITPLAVACALRDFYVVKFLIENHAIPRKFGFGIENYVMLNIGVFCTVRSGLC